MRLRTQTRGADVVRKWYEYLVEKGRGASHEYGFPKGKDLDAVVERVSHRGLLTAPSAIADMDKCLKFETVVEGSPYKVYLVHFGTTQFPKASRSLRGQPQLVWVTGVELSGHEHLGPPMVCGLPVSASSSAVYGALPLNLRFASKTPPLVLYHGTAGSALLSIAKQGLLPTAKPGMLGPGVYLARWDKACRFAGKPGDVVVRCLVFPGKTKTMTADDVCTCGCGQAYVDHHTEHGKGYNTTYVADNSLPATKHAEWCVRDPTCIIVDGAFEVQQEERGSSFRKLSSPLLPLPPHSPTSPSFLSAPGRPIPPPFPPLPPNPPPDSVDFPADSI
jgi:hypothetical protein